MKKVKDDLKIDDLNLPNIPIKIIRQDNQLKFTAGDFTLDLKEIKDGASQTYPLLLLDKFISEVTMKLLNAEIEERQNRAAAKKSLEFLGIDSDTEADNVIRSIHEHEFGGQE